MHAWCHHSIYCGWHPGHGFKYPYRVIIMHAWLAQYTTENNTDKNKTTCFWSLASIINYSYHDIYILFSSPAWLYMYIYISHYLIIGKGLLHLWGRYHQLSTITIMQPGIKNILCTSWFGITVRPHTHWLLLALETNASTLHFICI